MTSLGARLLALALFSPATALAWGATGHEYVSGIAAEALPEEIPAFLRTPASNADIAVLGRELDRSKGSGEPHDYERDQGHFIALDDAGTVRGLPLTELPETREAFDTEMRKRGSTQYRAGYLPYAIVDGFQQLVTDFAYWRAARVAAGNALDPADRAWFATDLARRERLIVRDLGVWSHYVGDASQPLHVSQRDNRWGDTPNPPGFPDARKLHQWFEGPFVREHVTRDAVARAVALQPYRDCAGCPIQERVRVLFLESHAHVMPLFELDRRGAFSGNDPIGVAFATARLAHGAAALRDMIVDAWRASAHAKISYPPIAVSDIEAGRHVLKRSDFGND
ncbi:MAG TPA: hypothetical protein VEC14_09725 [Reyranellaceae bacterium]|nr:hypothetical protein [Reyranellaceae bacterium]